MSRPVPLANMLSRAVAPGREGVGGLIAQGPGKPLPLVEMSPLIPLANILSRAVAPGREGVDERVAQGPG